MSTRASGFDRRPSDLYETPAWVIDALGEHVSLKGLSIWEPCCGSGKMVAALESHGAEVFATDILDQGYVGMKNVLDFTQNKLPIGGAFSGIVTNPPYGTQGRLGEAFIAQGLKQIGNAGFLALLLPVDFDSAKTRAKYFRDCPAYAAKIVLTRRICWFEPKPGQAGPSANHAWFIWERSHIRGGPAVTLYAPAEPLKWVGP